MDKEFNPYEFPASAEPAAPSDRVESEVVHVDPWLQDDSISAEERRRAAEEALAEAQAEEAAAEERRKAREANPFWQFISGNWLILEGITGTYRYLLIVAATLFMSVVSIFYSFHLGAKYTTRERSVQLLRERSLEYQRVRFNKTSHSAIEEELRRRNIQIFDLQESKTIIEK